MMKFNAPIDTGEMSIDRFIEWIYRAKDSNSANEGRAWILYELGHCNIPDSEAVGFNDDVLTDVLRAAIDAKEENDDQREV